MDWPIETKLAVKLTRDMTNFTMKMLILIGSMHVRVRI